MSENIDLTYQSSIENIDFAVYDWLNDKLNLSCNSKDGFKKVPVVWVTPERVFQIKENKEFRDADGTLNVPMITVERTSMIKDQKNSATYFSNINPDKNYNIISQRIDQKKTSEFTNATSYRRNKSIKFVTPSKLNQKVVYKFSSVQLPVYVTFMYNISLFTQFQQQMNEIVQPFLSRTGSINHFIIERNGFKYECFIEPNIDVKNNISSIEEEERRYITNITIKVLGVVVGQGENDENETIRTYENAVEIKLPRDNLIVAKQESVKKKIFPEQTPSNYGSQIYSNVLMKKVFLIGDGVNNQYTVVHNFNTRDIIVIVRENGGEWSRVEVAIDYSDLNHIEIDMGDVIDVNSYYVTIMG